MGYGFSAGKFLFRGLKKKVKKFVHLKIIKMKKIYLLLTCLSVLLFSCSTEEYLYKYNESTARYLQPSLSGYIIPMTADLNVSPTRISHSEIFDNELTADDFKSSNNSVRLTNEIELTMLTNNDSPSIQYMKNYTIGQAVKKYGADIIVAPMIEITTSADYTKITVTITGYPASYTNFRKMTESDAKLLDALQKNGVKQNASDSQTTKVMYLN